jgi:hypothetical protein
MCYIFGREIFVSKHACCSTANLKHAKIVISHLINTVMSNEVSFCFFKTFVIQRCLRSKSSLFAKQNDIYILDHTNDDVNKHV